MNYVPAVAGGQFAPKNTGPCNLIGQPTGVQAQQFGGQFNPGPPVCDPGQPSSSSTCPVQQGVSVSENFLQYNVRPPNVRPNERRELPLAEQFPKKIHPHSLLKET